MNSLIFTIDTAYEMILRFVLGMLRQVTDTFSVRHTVLAPSQPMIVEEPSIPIQEAPSFKKIDTLLPVSTHEEDQAITHKNIIMYASNRPTPVYLNPTIEFDTKIGEIPYGEMVMMLDIKGRFYKVVWNTLEGWALRGDLVDRAARVYPEFIIGQENHADHPNTVQLRAMIDDVFGIGHSDFPLQAGEYVLFRLWKKGIHVAWPEVRPRVPGLWHKILRGSPQARIGVVPHVGTIMEYLIGGDVGHLAYVEAVFPDDTITLSEINYPDSGKYNERVLTKGEWKELRPIFIQIQ